MWYDRDGFIRTNGGAYAENQFTPKELNDGFVVAINIEAKDNEGEAVAAILEGLVEPTMGEPGVKLFLPYRSPTNPSQFFIYELYKNEEAWGTHQATEHFKKAINELLPRVSRRDRVPFVPYVIPCLSGYHPHPLYVVCTHFPE